MPAPVATYSWPMRGLVRAGLVPILCVGLVAVVPNQGSRPALAAADVEGTESVAGRPLDSGNRTLELTGTYRRVEAIGRRGTAERIPTLDLLHTEDETFRLRLAGLPRPASGSLVRVGATDVRPDPRRGLLVQSITPVAERAVTARSAGPVATARGTDRVLVLRTRWAGKDGTSARSIRAVMQARGNEYWEEVSGGRYRVDVTVAKTWIRVPRPKPDCYSGSSRVMEAAVRKARSRGLAVGSFDRVVAYFPLCNTRAAGWAEAPGSLVWVNGTMDDRVTLHEQGHNLGLRHAGSRECGQRSLSGRCTSVEYGDPYDVMGGDRFTGHFSTSAKVALGWLPPKDVRTLAAGRRTKKVTLVAAERSSGKRALKVVAGKRAYWLEHRSRRGEDRGFPAGAFGVQVRTQLRSGGTELVDPSPGHGGEGTETPVFGRDLADAVIPTGASWTSPEGVRFTVLSSTASKAVVRVRRGAPAPKVPGAPSNISARGGDTTATVSWQTPSGNGAVLTRHTVTVVPQGGGAGRSKTLRTTRSGALSTVVAGLVNGTDYRVSVRSANEVGAGPAGMAADRVTVKGIDPGRG